MNQTGPKQVNNPTGSPDNGEPLFITIGKIRRAHGVDGEMVVEKWSERDELFKPGSVIHAGTRLRDLKIRTRRDHDKFLLLSFHGFDDVDQAMELTNLILYVRKESLPALPDGEYYHFELVGLRVEDEQGNNLGVLSEVMVTGANDVYVVTSEDGKEILLPVIPDVIKQIDINSSKMIVHPPEWA
jgi:16S rRNA processing protein RimM